LGIGRASVLFCLWLSNLAQIGNGFNSLPNPTDGGKEFSL
jgi:hypothetical protein